jgi:hypothetical protein
MIKEIGGGLVAKPKLEPFVLYIYNGPKVFIK